MKFLRKIDIRKMSTSSESDRNADDRLTKRSSHGQTFSSQNYELATRCNICAAHFLRFDRAVQDARLHSCCSHKDVLLIGRESKVGLGIERWKIRGGVQRLLESACVPDWKGAEASGFAGEGKSVSSRLTVPSPPRVATCLPSDEKTTQLVVHPGV